MKPERDDADGPGRRCSAPRSLLALTLLAGVIVHTTAGCATSISSQARADMVRGHVVSNGAAVAGAKLTLGGTMPAIETDADGAFELHVPAQYAEAYVVYVTATAAGHDRVFAALPLALGPLDVTFDLAHDTVGLRNASARQQAWIDVRGWVADAVADSRKLADGDQAGQRALWSRLTTDIEHERDAWRRGLMIVGQFSVGRGDLEHGLSRRDVAAQALVELPLDDPRWALEPWSLVIAMHESGRLDEFAPTLDPWISSHPQPEVAAYIALERTMATSARQEWDTVDAIWVRVQARPELLAGMFGAVIESLGPNRPLAVGRMLDDFCAEDLAGGRVCTAELRGRVVVLEFWSTWCSGCREAAAALAVAHAKSSEPVESAPVFLSVDVYDDPAEIEGFLREQPMPWRHAWLAPSDRESFRERFEIQSIPLLAVVDPEGRIVASSPGLRAEDVGDVVERVRGPDPAP